MLKHPSSTQRRRSLLAALRASGDGITVRSLAIVALGCLPGCAGHYRADAAQPRFLAPAAADVIRLKWSRVLRRHKMLDYRPENWTTPLLTADGKLLVGSSDGGFRAYDAESGRLLWNTKAGRGTFGEPLLLEDTNTVYFGSGDGTMYAVDTTTGTVRWRYETRGAINRPPFYSEGYLLFTTTEERVYCLDAETGKWRWQYEREIPEGFTIQGNSGVAVADAHAFVGFADGHLVALQVYSGDVVWTRDLAQSKNRFVDVDATPVVVGDTLIAANFATGVFAVSLETGSVKWQHAASEVNELVVGEGAIFYTTPTVGMAAIDLEGNQLWRQGAGKGGFGRPVIRRGLVFVGGKESGLHVASARTGELLQSFRRGHGFDGTAAVGARYVAAVSNQGVLYTFSLVRSAQQIAVGQ